MQDRNANIKILRGLFESFPMPEDSVFELINWQVDKYTGGWTNKLGYEKYDTAAANYNPFVTNRVDSMFYVQRHQGAQDSILFEQGGALYHLNDFQDTLQKNVLSSSRTIPRPSEVGTQYSQFGRFVIYANGYDKPSKSYLWPVTSFTTNYLIEYPLGFDALPPAPVVWDVETDPTLNQAAGDKASLWFFDPNIKDKGIGIATSAKVNRFKYRVSYVNNAGAEGPMSTPSNTIDWTTPSGKLRFAIPVEIPIGGTGTIARRLYRTKNFSADGGNSALNYFFVAEIANNGDDIYVDDTPDTALGSAAPLDTDSIPLPSTTCRYLGVYKDCLFIDGGRDNDLTLFYSFPAQPDRFAALSFFTLSHRQGGGLTGMYSYFNNLLIFREYSIDIVRGDYPNFNATNLTRHVGTRATNTIVSIPGMGTVFLSYDGIYSININLDYNDNPTVRNITEHLKDTFARINVDAIEKSCAVYSKKRRELIIHFPVDGSPFNNFGLVFHVDKGAWSTRQNVPAGQLIVNGSGDVLFGMNDTAPSTNDEHGIMVLSSKRAAGSQIVGESIQDRDPLTSTIRSAWLDMGDASIKKKVHSVYLFIATGGNQTIPMDYYMDFDYNTVNTTSPLQLQRPDFINQNVYDVVQLDIGKYWEEPLMTTIRYDVHSKACSHFQWKVSTQQDITIVGYAIDFTSKGMRVIKGKKL